MTCLPPVRFVPPLRSGASGWRRGALITALAACVAAAGCRETIDVPAGLLVSSNGSLYELDGEAALRRLDALPDVRHVASAGDTVVIATAGGDYDVASPAGPSLENVTWRDLDVDVPVDGFTAGIDVSPDGRSLAVVTGHEAEERLDLDVIDLEGGGDQRRAVGMAPNGPPSWLANDLIALEVVAGNKPATVVSVGVEGGAPVESGSRGFALSLAGDGRRIAVADEATGSIVVRDIDDWWAGVPGPPGISPPVDLAVQDIAIDGDESRLAVLYAHGNSPLWTLTIYSLRDGRWGPVRSIEIAGDVPPTIDWLE